MEQNTLAKQNILTFGWFISLSTLIISAMILYVDIISKKFGTAPSIISEEFATYDFTADSRIFMVYIILFSAVFIFLTYRNIKKVEQGTHKVENNSLRIFLSHLLLWFSGVLIFASVVSLLYKLLGAEFTKSEIYQELLVLVISAVVFIYEFFTKTGEGLRFSYKQITTAFSAFVILFSLGSVLATFALVGSPVEIRKQAQDQTVISSISTMQDAVVFYFQEYREMPKTLQDAILSYESILDIDYSKYQYRVTSQPTIINNTHSGASFEICSNLSTSKQNTKTSKNTKLIEFDIETTYWNHSAGNNCYNFAIDPEGYPFDSVEYSSFNSYDSQTEQKT